MSKGKLQLIQASYSLMALVFSFTTIVQLAMNWGGEVTRGKLSYMVPTLCPGNLGRSMGLPS